MLMTQSSPPEAGEGKKHKHQLQEGSHQHPSAGGPLVHCVFSYLREQVPGTRCKWSKRHLRPSSPSWFLERLKGRRTMWPTKTQPLEQVAQRGGGFPIPGNIQGLVGQGSEKSGLVEDVPARDRGLD